MTENPLSKRHSDLIGNLTEGLTEDQKRELREVAARKQMELESKAREAGIRHDASTADMRRDLEVVDQLQYGDRDTHFTLTGNYQGGSGHTRMEVSRREPFAAAAKWLIIGAVIIGVLIALAN